MIFGELCTAYSNENSKSVNIKVIKVSNCHDRFFSSKNIFMISLLTSEVLQTQSAKFKLLPQNMSWPGTAFGIIYVIVILENQGVSKITS